jgi:hypothetical protein
MTLDRARQVARIERSAIHVIRVNPALDLAAVENDHAG